MLLAIFMAFLSPVVFAVSTVADSHLTNKVFRMNTTLLFYGTITGMLLIPILFLFGTPKLPPPRALPLLTYVGFVEIAYLVPYYMSLRRLDTSVITALFTLTQVMLPVLAYFVVGEKLSPLQYFGFFLIIFTSAALSLGRRRGKLKINSAFWLMIIASALTCVSAVCQKSILGDLDWVSMVFWTGVISGASVTPLLFYKKTRRDIAASWTTFRRKFAVIILTNCFTFAGVMTEVFAISELPVTMDKAIHASQPFFGLLFGVILARVYGRDFGEDDGPRAILRKMIGFTIIFAGIMMTVLA